MRLRPRVLVFRGPSHGGGDDHIGSVPGLLRPSNGDGIRYILNLLKREIARFFVSGRPPNEGPLRHALPVLLHLRLLPHGPHRVLSKRRLEDAAGTQHAPTQMQKYQLESPFQIVLTLPTVLFVSYWWFMPESIRWLISKGRLDEASSQLRRVARENGVEMSEGQIGEMVEAARAEHQRATTEKNK